MRNNKRFIVAMACMMAMGLTACGDGNDNTANDIQQVEPNFFTENAEQGDSDIEKQNATEAQGTRIPSDGQQGAQEQVVPDSDEKLEEKLAAYREARENAKPTSLGNGVHWTK